MNISGLMSKGVLRIASEPPGNWRDIGSAEVLTIPLIAEDYPAKTAAMWNSAYEKIGMPHRNTMMVADPGNAAEILRAFKADDRYRGGGAGVGFKEIVIPYLDRVTSLAKAMGAVNIIRKNRDGSMEGNNTDGEGYARGLEEILAEEGKSLNGSRVLILGAGGSGRAIAFALANGGAKLTILNRTESKAQELAASINDYFGHGVAAGGGREMIDDILPSQDAVVSVIDDAKSPLDEYSTLGSMRLPITEGTLWENKMSVEMLLRRAKPSLVVSDIRIRKRPTAMLQQAEVLGFRTLDGIPMVVNQGIAAFRWVYQDFFDMSIGAKEIQSIMREAAYSRE